MIMTQNEFVGLLKINLMEVLHKRDCTSGYTYPEEYGYFNGQFRAYESIIIMLSALDIESITAGDARNIMQ